MDAYHLLSVSSLSIVAQVATEGNIPYSAKAYKIPEGFVCVYIIESRLSRISRRKNADKQFKLRGGRRVRMRQINDEERSERGVNLANTSEHTSLGTDARLWEDA